ncbi:unnamed protein product [Prunus armeniaca]
MSKARGEEEEDTECFYNSLGELWLVGGNWSLGWDKGKKKSGTKGGGGVMVSGNGGKENRRGGHWMVAG